MNTFQNRSTMVAAAAFAAFCGEAMGQSYTIQVLHPLPGYAQSFATGINESGVVVGTSRTGSVWRATRWINGVPTDLGTVPGATQAIPLAITTDGNTIVGEASSGANVIPFIWESGVITVPAGPAATYAGCWDINDSGVVVGRAFSVNQPTDGVACKWEKVGGVWTFSALSPLTGATGAGAFGVNNNGVIAGFSGGNTWNDVRAVTWHPPTALLGAPVGATASYTNLAGQSVGDVSVPPGGPFHACVHSGNTLTDLGTLVYPQSYAFRINEAGTAIGQSYGGPDPTQFPDDNKVAIIWKIGPAITMTAVNDLIPVGSGWDVKQLWDISESGRIVGLGRFNGLWRGCLLIPVCYANCDNSTAAPTLTANDFQCFLNRFAAGDSYANCDGSTATPELTANDFQCFLNKYASGCT